MTWYSDLGTRGKIFIGLGAIWLLLAAVIVVAYDNINEITESEREIHDVGLVKVLNLQRIRAFEALNRCDILEMSLTNDRGRQEQNEANLKSRGAEIEKMLILLTSVELDPGLRSRLQELNSLIQQHRKNRELQAAAVSQGKTEDIRLAAMGALEQRFDQISAILSELGQQESARLDKILSRDVERGSTAVRVFMGLGAGSFFLGLAIIWILNRIVAEILQAVNQLGATAGEMLSASTQVASGASETAAAIGETTTTVEQVRQASQLSNQKAQDVSSSARSVAQVSHDGKKAVDEAALGMQQISREMEDIAKTIVLLSEQGQAIGGIIATVTDLADQSNLLAVNAAIEAAKAGEQGKGFAVVAQEIKSLSEQSKQATTQVRTILGDVQRATGTAVMAAEKGNKAVENGVRQFALAGEAIRLLAETTGLATQAATQIVVSSQQQAVGMDQIGVAMENIRQAGADTVVAMKQVELSAQNLNELGQRLKRLVVGDGGVRH